MSEIKYYALDENEEVPYEFVVTRNVNGELELCASFVNTNSLAYENGVLLKLHQRNNELRAENAKLRDYLEHKRHLQDFVRLVSENARLREACAELLKMAERHDPEWLHWPEIHDELRKLGVEVEP